MSESTRRTRVVVRGRVQGVGFRDACARQAMRRSVNGWVRNLADGSVEAVFEGKPDDVDYMVEWCRRGPLVARVRGLELNDEAPVGEGTFEIR